MALILDALFEILRKPTVGNVVAELPTFAAPLWIAVLVGLFVGWAWRPRWAAGLVGGENVALGGRRLPPSGTSSADSFMAQLPGSIGSSIPDKGAGEEANMVVASPPDGKSDDEVAVTAGDLEHLIHLVEETDGGPVWHQMLDRSLPNMSYQAWRRDSKTGPPQYRTRTIFEDATPETVRDFFWDDEFRIKNGWDDMLLYHETLKECRTTGTMLVHWIRKFPFFCSDREYTIGRRIWDSGRTYYCVTKGVPCHSVPRRKKPRRVDLYYSSWCIRAVESREGDGQLTACEVLLFHHEDMGIPWEIAKLGVRQGMWGCVKRIEPGLRAYEITRRSDEPLSQCALMAQINTNFKADDLRSLEVGTCSSSEIIEAEKQKHWAGNIPKFLVIGGAVTLACTLDYGLLTKAIIFGVARRFVKQGRRL